MTTKSPHPARGRAGFTLVEVIVALLILTIGVLGLAGTTGLVVRQVTASKISTERSAALQASIEQVRAIDFGALEGSGTVSVGEFETSWSVSDEGGSKVVQLITVGPGLQATEGNMYAPRPNITDTFSYRVIRGR